MITRQYYGLLQDKGLILRGDYTRIAQLCNEKNLNGIDGGAIDRKAIMYIIGEGRACTPEVAKVITDFYNERMASVEEQNKVINDEQYHRQ